MFIVTLCDMPEMIHLPTVDGRSFVSYLDDISEKQYMLNKQLQGSNITLVAANTKIYGFATFTEVCQKT